MQVIKDITLDALFKERVKERRFEKLHHVSLHESMYNHIQILLNHTSRKSYKITKKIPTKLNNELAKYKLDNLASIIKADVYSVPVEKKTIWPRTQRNDSVIDYNATNVEIELPNKSKAHLWTIAKASRGHSGDDIWAFLSFAPEDVKIIEDFFGLIDRLRTAITVRDKKIRVYGGSNLRIKGQYSWDDLILPQHILRSVKDDLEFWMSMEAHYKTKKIPYRRGYLFEGPPGNGKTATARVILSNYDFTGFMFNFSHPRLDDSDLMEAFNQAANQAPAIFVLEDIDRVFDRSGSHFCNITLECLFNCLDGIAINEGLVVIATANHPETLDSAIRLRPGRFDVPVRFGNPDKDQRSRFFHKMFNDALKPETFDYLVTHTENMSMAFLKLVYETSGVNAFKRLNGKKSLEITDTDATLGLTLALKYYEQMSTGSDRAAGFKTRKRRRLIHSENIDKTVETMEPPTCDEGKSSSRSPVKRMHPTIPAERE